MHGHDIQGCRRRYPVGTERLERDQGPAPWSCSVVPPKSLRSRNTNSVITPKSKNAVNMPTLNPTTTAAPAGRRGQDWPAMWGQTLLPERGVVAGRQADDHPLGAGKIGLLDWLGDPAGIQRY